MLTDKVRENPIKSTVSALTLAIGLFAGVISIDSRYAKAEDFNKQQQALQQNAKDTAFAIDQLRKQSIEDKIFEIELLPEDKRSQYDKARLEKYHRDIKTIDQKWQK